MQVNGRRWDRGMIFPFPVVAASCVPRMNEIATSSHSFIVWRWERRPGNISSRTTRNLAKPAWLSEYLGSANIPQS